MSTGTQKISAGFSSAHVSVPTGTLHQATPKCCLHSCDLAAALSMLVRSVLMTPPRSSLPNTALPATMTFAPAFAAWSMVDGEMPPSTWNASVLCWLKTQPAQTLSAAVLLQATCEVTVNLVS